MSDDIDIHTETTTDRTVSERRDASTDSDPGTNRRPLEHVTVENDDAPDECAIFPSEASERELTTTWISAQEGSFVDLESTR